MPAEELYLVGLQVAGGILAFGIVSYRQTHTHTHALGTTGGNVILMQHSSDSTLLFWIRRPQILLDEIGFFALFVYST